MDARAQALATTVQEAYRRYAQVAKQAEDPGLREQAAGGMQVINQLVGVLRQASPVVGVVPDAEMEGFRRQAQPWAAKAVGFVDQHSKALEDQMLNYQVEPAQSGRVPVATGDWWNPLTWFLPTTSDVSTAASEVALMGGLGIALFALYKVVKNK